MYKIIFVPYNPKYTDAATKSRCVPCYPKSNLVITYSEQTNCGTDHANE